MRASLRSHPHPGRRLIIGLTLVVTYVSLTACGAVAFLKNDPSEPRSRAARFDRFVKEAHLEHVDTATRLERIRAEAARPPAHPHLNADVQARSSVGFAWTRSQRRSARLFALRGQLETLESDFPPGRLGTSSRALAARTLARDLRRALRLDDGENGVSALDREPSIAPPSPWSGSVFSGPTTLAHELPRDTPGNLEDWSRHLEALADEILAESEEVTAEGLAEAYGPRAPIIVRAMLDDVVRMRTSVGTAAPTDPLLGPYVEALAQLDSLVGEGNVPDRTGAMPGTGARAQVPRALRTRLADAIGAMDAALRKALDVLDPTFGAQTVAPLRGSRRKAWLLGLRDVAGPRATPESLEALGRREVRRLTREIGLDLDVDSVADLGQVRAAFDEIRRGRRDVSGSRSSGVPRENRSPEQLWALARERLSRLVRPEDTPRVVVSRAEARNFDRPRGRWTPYVRGDLRPIEAGASGLPPRAGVYLAPRERDPMTPTWLREADALRYGIPGHALVDAFRRAATDTPLYLRLHEREAFTEGWALYALAQAEATDLVPGVDRGFGRRASELIAFASMVVDIGLHERGWSVDQATATLQELTPLRQLPAREIVYRSITFPGRVSLPAIGLLRIRSLRREIETTLGDAFDAREFHAAILQEGPIPIAEIDASIERWLDARDDRVTKQ